MVHRIPCICHPKSFFVEEKSSTNSQVQQSCMLCKRLCSPPDNQHLKVFGQSLRAPSIVHQHYDSGSNVKTVLQSPSTPATSTEEPFSSLNSSTPCARRASHE